MKNIEKLSPFQSSIEKTAHGTVTVLSAANGVSAKDTLGWNNSLLTADYVYDDSGNYQLVYTVVDKDGNHQSYAENDGILPRLFLSPDQQAYASVVPYHPDKELEISIPVFERGSTKLPKGTRPFTGDFVGVTDSFSIFFDVDRFNGKKEDKMLSIEFKNGVIKKKYPVKIPFPRNNKILVAGNEVHLLAKHGAGWLHRLIDEKGTVIRERTIEAAMPYFWQILQLSFEDNSYLLYEEEGKISVILIRSGGESDVKELFDIGDGFFNTWLPEKVAIGTSVTRFNTEFGNGWLTIKDNELLELFYNKETGGYKNLLTNGVIPVNHKPLAIAGLSKTKENAYSVVFYPMKDANQKNKDLIVVNRSIS